MPYFRNPKPYKDTGINQMLTTHELRTSYHEVDVQRLIGKMPVCPRGFDCGLINSCPNYYLPCPEGFFCSSYQGFYDQDLMDLRYASYAMRYEGVDITDDDKGYYIDYNRAIQCSCLQSFYCPTATTMYSCPGDEWCAEGTVDPFPCDPLSMCEDMDGYYQINFINFLIGLILSAGILILSTILIRRQLRKNEISRKIDADEEKAKFLSNKQQQRQNLLDNPVSNKASSFNGTDRARVYSSSTIEVAFRGIEVSFPSSERPILHSISGQIPPAQMSLLLGPSASGKTTLLKVLRTGGRIANAGKVTFTMVGNPSTNNPLSVNEAIDLHPSQTSSLLENMLDEQRSLLPSELSKYVGYVPQDDILDRPLTVREQLTFHAQTRLANEQLSKRIINQIVEEVMVDLNILHIADSIIGGNENAAANISGGQLKRVNIACELVALASPAVLLLDEPTNGLDASIAYELIESLASLKEKNITIFTVLQQPRSEIFQLMDHLLLMGPHGNIVYEGGVEEVSSQLMTLGYEPYSIETSDADFCVDVLNQMKWQDDVETVQHEHDHVHPRRSSLIQSEKEELSKAAKTVQILVNCFSFNQLKENLQQTLLNPIFYQLIYYNMKRLFQVRLRNRVQLVVSIIIAIMMAIALASGFSILITDSYLSVLVPPVRFNMQGYYPQPLELMRTHNADQFALTQLLFFLCATLGCASCLAGVPVFANHRNVALREKSSGLSITAYGIGRMIGDLPFVLMTSMVFAGVWCCFGMSGSYYNWMGTCVCTTYAASAIGYLTSVSSTGNNANVYAIIVTFIFCVFSGSEPSLTQVAKYPIVNWPWYLSFGTWTSEAAYVTWSAYLSDNPSMSAEVQQGADTFGYDVSHGLTRSALALLAIGTGMRIMVLIILNRIS